MTLYDMLAMSIGNLWRRKLRTFLTILGVLIGTTSIVCMLSLGIGMKKAMLDQFALSSATQITISSGEEYGDSSNIDEDKLLTDSVMKQFASMEHVVSAEPQLEFEVNLEQGKYQDWSTIRGVSEEQMKEFKLAEGELSNASGSKMHLIAGNSLITMFYYMQGEEYVDYYSTGELLDVDLLNKPMKYTYYNEYADRNNTNAEDNLEGDELSDTNTDAETTDDTSTNEEASSLYTDYYSHLVDFRAEITGIMEGEVDSYTEASQCLFINIEDLKAYLTKNYKKGSIPGQPLRSDGKPYKEWIYNKIIVNVDDADSVEEVKQTIQDQGFSASSNKELLDEINKEIKIVEIVLGGIGMIAFLVAAIGIANTMMMSTYERTKEIGIMKVLGCNMHDIQNLFLSEAGFIGLLGGILGLGLSCLLSSGINYAARTFMDAGNMKISLITWWLALIAIVFSTLMGMLAGYFPARRAMKLSALAAIRNE